MRSPLLLRSPLLVCTRMPPQSQSSRERFAARFYDKVSVSDFTVLPTAVVSGTVLTTSKPAVAVAISGSGVTVWPATRPGNISCTKMTSSSVKYCVVPQSVWEDLKLMPKIFRRSPAAFGERSSKVRLQPEICEDEVYMVCVFVAEALHRGTPPRIGGFFVDVCSFAVLRAGPFILRPCWPRDYSKIRRGLGLRGPEPSKFGFRVVVLSNQLINQQSCVKSLRALVARVVQKVTAVATSLVVAVRST